MRRTGRTPGSDGSPDGLPSFSLVVPLYNEEERFEEHAPELGRFIARFDAPSHLICVDDGSTDGTVATVERYMHDHPDLPVVLIRRPHEGKGAAVRAGLQEADSCYAGFCDVDLSTPLAELLLILRAASAGEVLAIGSRDLGASRLVHRQGRLRELLGKTFNRLVQLTVAPGISDTQCGAKVAATPVWQAILPYCRQSGFAWDVEAIKVARKLGLVVREVAIEWSHDNRSRVRVGRDGLAMVAALPAIVLGSRTIAPDARFEQEGSGVFDDHQASTLIESDTDHWWFRSKGAYVSAVLKRHRQPGAPPFLLDVGAGSGGVTAILGWPPGRMAASDGSEKLLRVARERHALPVLAGSTERLAVRDAGVGVITMLDVIEHLGEPVKALRAAHRALRQGGQLIVTVPAHQWLWSSADEMLGHVRRYSRAALREELHAAGFEPVVLTHVFSWLVIPVWLQRRLATSKDGQLGLDQRSALLDRLAFLLTRLEWMVAQRVSLPVGTSILCLARKAGDPPGDWS